MRGSARQPMADDLKMRLLERCSWSTDPAQIIRVLRSRYLRPTGKCGSENTSIARLSPRKRAEAQRCRLEPSDMNGMLTLITGSAPPGLLVFPPQPIRSPMIFCSTVGQRTAPVRPPIRPSSTARRVVHWCSEPARCNGRGDWMRTTTRAPRKRQPPTSGCGGLSQPFCRYGCPARLDPTWTDPRNQEYRHCFTSIPRDLSRPGRYGDGQRNRDGYRDSK